MGAVAGYYTNGGKTRWTYTMKSPVPILLMHGSLDKTIAFAGGVPENDPTRKTLSYQETLSAWAANNRCAPKPTISAGESLPGRGRGGPVSFQRFDGCQAATEGIVLPGVGHTWIDVNSTGFNGTLRAVEFFGITGPTGRTGGR